MKRILDALTAETFDLLILGGGITGAGVALDAATRGWRVALIDKGDFASGTSSASSKLVHGGLRYLESGQLHLVHEALRERGRLLRSAPHLVRPLPFILPFYRGARVPAWKWRLGLTLYDVLAGRANIHRSRALHRAQLLHDYPALRAADMVGGALYYDAQMDDASLCLAVLQSAARHGAMLANYVEAVGFERGAVHARDAVSGRALVIRARQVLNATGPWVDAVCRLAGDKAAPRLQPTKGVHLLAPARHGEAAFLLLHPRDGRVFFVLPWYGKMLLGTTDTFADAGPDHLQVRPEEIAYLLEGYNHHFAPGLDAAEVIGSFAGLRPLVHQGAGTPSGLSREYRLFTSPAGLVSVAGGKYTTFRQMAEEITAVLARRLNKPGFCRTRELPLEGTPTEPWPAFVARAVPALQAAGLTGAAARHLLQRYGTAAFAVLPYVRDGVRVHPEEPDLRGELAYQREEEMALFSPDHFLRRSRIGLFHAELLARSDLG
jgi:glycerol-3-phosphate dehydrogenase